MADRLKTRIPDENVSPKAQLRNELYPNDWKVINIKKSGACAIITEAFDTGRDVIVRHLVMEENGVVVSVSSILVPAIRLREITDSKTGEKKWTFNRGTI